MYVGRPMGLLKYSRRDISWAKFYIREECWESSKCKSNLEGKFLVLASSVSQWYLLILILLLYWHSHRSFQLSALWHQLEISREISSLSTCSFQWCEGLPLLMFPSPDTARVVAVVAGVFSFIRMTWPSQHNRYIFNCCIVLMLFYNWLFHRPRYSRCQCANKHKSFDKLSFRRLQRKT